MKLYEFYVINPTEIGTRSWYDDLRTTNNYISVDWADGWEILQEGDAWVNEGGDKIVSYVVYGELNED